MKILNRYIMKELIPPIILSGVFFSGVLLLVKFFDIADLLVKADLKPFVLTQVMLLILLTLFSLTVPMAILMGTLIGMGRLTNENEILAIRASGISLRRIFWPVVHLATAVTVVLIIANAFFIPQVFQKFDAITYKVQFDLLTSLKPKTFYDQFGPEGSQISIYFEEVEGLPQEGELDMVGVNMFMRVKNESLLEGDGSSSPSGRSNVLVFAQSGSLRANEENQNIELELFNGVWLPMESSPTADVGVARIIRFESARQILGSTELDEAAQRSPQQLSQWDLWKYLRAEKPATPRTEVNNDRRRVTPEWQRYFSARNEWIQRLTLPLSALAFAIVAFSLAVEVRPRAKSFSAIIAIGFMLFYYAMLTAAGAVGSVGAPFLVTFLCYLLPNVLIAGFGIVIFFRANRR